MSAIQHGKILHVVYVIDPYSCTLANGRNYMR